MPEAIENINFGFSSIFVVEMILKSWGLGLRQYLRDPFNVFDVVVVGLFFVEVFLSPPQFLIDAVLTPAGIKPILSTGGGISVMRTFRLMRLFKLVRSWTRMQRLLGDIYSTIKQGKWFLVVFLLFLFISALIGMQLLANRMAFDPETGELVPFGDPQFSTAYRPRWNFDSMWYTMATIVQVR